MPDNLTRKQRSYCMSRIKGKDTGLEIQVRAALRKRKLRFQTNVKGMPGKPDIVFSKARVVVFVDGDFWHGYRFPIWKRKVSAFWRNKILKNRQRDARNFRKLRRMGWIVVRIWQHQIQNDFESCISRILSIIKNKR
jgi:DNA mismatch endonuclease (patch repair protein)